MIAKTHSEPYDVRRRLTELGLDEDALLQAARRGQVARAGYTAFYPASFPGLAAWAETVAALREALCPRHWHAVTESNFCLAVSPDGTLAIAVATGDEDTGIADGEPQTRSSKGKKTLQAVGVNVRQLDIFVDGGVELPSDPSGWAPGSPRTTWMFLIHTDIQERELRCEFSLPTGVDADGHVDGWAERIILTATPLDGDTVSITDDLGPSGPEIDIDVQRRA